MEQMGYVLETALLTVSTNEKRHNPSRGTKTGPLTAVPSADYPSLICPFFLLHS